MDFLKNILNRIKEWFAGIWDKTEKRDRMRFLVITAVALTLLIAAFAMLGGDRYAELITGADANAIEAAKGVLSENGIGYKVSGNTLLVGKNDVTPATSLLMQSGRMPYEPNYSLYERGSGLTNTAEDRARYHQFMLEDSLRQTLERYEMVDTAAVHLNFPDNSRAFFSGEMQQNSATVNLSLRGTLERSHVDTIVSHVANAANIPADNVTVSDQHGNTLNKVTISDEMDLQTRRYAFKKMVESDLADALVRDLSMVFGRGRVTATVRTRFNYDEYSSNAQTFFPVVGDDEGIIRSFETLYEMAKGPGGPYGGQPGTDEDGLGEDYAEVEEMLSEYEQRRNITNLEVSELNELMVREQGKLEEITVSVIVDSNAIEVGEENREALERIVAGNIGLRQGEYAANVAVEFMPMRGVEGDMTARNDYDEWLRQQELYELIKFLALYLVIGFCVIILIWRTFAFVKPKPVEVPAMEEDFLLGDMDDYGELLEAATADQELEVTKTPSRERIEQFVDSNPEAVANMLRNWLQEDEGGAW